MINLSNLKARHQEQNPSILPVLRTDCTRGLFHEAFLKDKYPNFEVGLKCIIMVNPYLLVCSYIK